MHKAGVHPVDALYAHVSIGPSLPLNKLMTAAQAAEELVIAGVGAAVAGADVMVAEHVSKTTLNWAELSDGEGSACAGSVRVKVFFWRRRRGEGGGQK